MPESDVNASGADRRQREERSLGELLGEATRDMSELVRKEVQLAKVEMHQEAAKAARAGAALGAGGIVGYLALLLASFAAAWGLAEVIAPGWAFLVVAAVYALVAMVLVMRGRTQLRKVSPKPQQTIETLKEDVEWAKTQTR